MRSSKWFGDTGWRRGRAYDRFVGQHNPFHAQPVWRLKRLAAPAMGAVAS
jgi:hypothetical protein